jgi:transposase InsO family protein
MQREDPDLAAELDKVKDHPDYNSDKCIEAKDGRTTYHDYKGLIYHATTKPRKGLLEKEPAPCGCQHRVLAPTKLRTELMREAHNSLIAGHAGVFKTSERIRNDFWWATMDADITDHIRACVPCQSATDKGKLQPPPASTQPACTGPNQRVHIDLFGALKDSDNGNNHVLVITDAFTKEAHAYPVKGKKAPEVTAVFIKRFLYERGCPAVIMSDQGKEFCNQFNNTLWDSQGIERKVTTPYHPQCNAAAEVFNKTLRHYVATVIIEADKSTLDWELYLGPLMLSYNTSVNKITRVTPFYAAFGYDPQLPLWEGVIHPNDETLANPAGKTPLHDLPFAAHLARIREAQNTARRIIVHNNQHARDQQQRQSAKSNPDAVWPSFDPGQKVWLRVDQKNQPNPKLAPNWERATIVERSTLATYRVRQDDRKRKRVKTVNVQKLKPRVDEAEPEPFVAPEPDDESIMGEDDHQAESDFQEPEDTDEEEDDEEQPPAEPEEPENEEAPKPEPRYNLRTRKKQAHLVAALDYAMEVMVNKSGYNYWQMRELLDAGGTLLRVSSGGSAPPPPPAGGGVPAPPGPQQQAAITPPANTRSRLRRYDGASATRVSDRIRGASHELDKTINKTISKTTKAIKTTPTRIATALKDVKTAGSRQLRQLASHNSGGDKDHGAPAATTSKTRSGATKSRDQGMEKTTPARTTTKAATNLAAEVWQDQADFDLEDDDDHESFEDAPDQPEAPDEGKTWTWGGLGLF